MSSTAPATTAPPVLSETRGRTAILTLNRPEKLNAWSPQMAQLLREKIDEANADPGIGAIVITGAGRGFCSGADLRRDRNAEAAAARQGRESDPMPFFMQRSKPLIAAINGPAIGIGLTLTLNCDVRIAAESARLSARFVRIGLTPEFGSSYLLPQIVGLGTAAELVLTGRIIDAPAAGQLGLVNKVVPDASLIDEAVALAEEIAFNPSQQVRWAKQLLYANAANDNFYSVIHSEQEIFGQATRTETFAEAGRAFAEKRQPNFHQ